MPRITVFLLSLLLSAQVLSQSPVTIQANPRITNHLTNVKIRVESSEANRHLWLEWYRFEGFEQRKYWQLDGAGAKKFYEARLSLEEPGEWTVRARVVRNDESIALAVTTVTVPGSE